MTISFSFASTPHIHFGIGRRDVLPDIIRGYGRKVLLLTGGKSFEQSPLCQRLWNDLSAAFDVQRVSILGEPSPQVVDAAVSKYHAWQPDCVVALGGGSCVDAAKAIAGLLPSGDSVMAYLEGVGEGKVFTSNTTPFIALPTTAGTGGETSKNAVLSMIGDEGFKKSFRHESLVPKHIILDPELTISCSKEVTAACGMDAFTQLLESYVSSNANPMTDSLAWSGLMHVRDSLLQAVAHGDDLKARSGMLYASSISGLTLANAGLGSVHGLASPFGAFFPIAHGVVCGALLYDATRINMDVMSVREPSNIALKKYADVGRMMLENEALDDVDARVKLLKLLKTWSKSLNMPKLSTYGVKKSDISRLINNISGGSMSTNPVALTEVELTQLIEAVL
ncbi:MAG: iron-containing alcohol dehydrogenase [Mariprofundaceae bacterium]|nr:iron-containing alcohol dehydrogenase [Mariprofundaceae bacterium]